LLKKDSVSPDDVLRLNRITESEWYGILVMSYVKLWWVIHFLLFPDKWHDTKELTVFFFCVSDITSEIRNFINETPH
jgi:hypothetical protein